MARKTDTFFYLSEASRPHAELAACGVGGMQRLTGGAGSEFDWNAWRVVVKGGLVDALLRTTTSLRLFAHRDSAPLDIAPRAFQSKAATARLLTNALAETYFRHGDCLDFETLTCLVDALVSVAKHAKQAAGEAGAGNNNTHRTDDSFMTCLAVETEARRATLAVCCTCTPPGEAIRTVLVVPPSSLSSSSPPRESSAASRPEPNSWSWWLLF